MIGKALVACEESQAVCIELRRKGWEAYSCDILPCSGGRPEWHIQGDAIKILYSQKWDLVIAHPPCTRLANSGVRWLTSRKPRIGYEWSEKENIFINSDIAVWEALYEGCKFFNHFVLYGKLGGTIRIENPIQHKYARRLIDPPTQIIQPWQFGHKEMKATCIWNFNIDNLKPTDIVGPPPKNKIEKIKWQKIWTASPGPDRAKLRSKTYPGIANAIAAQSILNVCGL